MTLQGSSRPRVLFIGTGTPWEGGAGYLLRQHMFLQALDAIAELHLAVFDGIWKNPAPYGRSVTPLPLDTSVSESRLRRFWNDLTSPLPLAFRTHGFVDTRRVVQSLNPDSFDAIFAYRPDFAHFAGVLGHPRLILDIDDPEHIRRKLRFQTHELSRFDWRSRLELRRIRNFEFRAVRQSVRAFVCQELDQRAFKPPLPMVVPNCVHVPPHCPPQDTAAHYILFVGGLINSNQSPNVDAIRWFISAVWPCILAQDPSAQFHVVGEVKPSLQPLLRQTPNLIMRGFVDDLADAYRHAAFSIAPIRYGTGTRMKILESMALGCPVISSPKGWEGLDISPSTHLLQASTPQEWVASCISLLKNPTLRSTLAEAAFHVVKQNYDVDARRPWLASVLAAAIADARAVPVSSTHAVLA